MQEDARLIGAKPEEFNKKVSLVVFKVKDDKPKGVFDNVIGKTLLTHRRDLYFELDLDIGQYIIIPGTSPKGDCANFILEFYFYDKLLSNTKNNIFNFNQLKYTRIKRFGESTKLN